MVRHVVYCCTQSLYFSSKNPGKTPSACVCVVQLQQRLTWQRLISALPLSRVTRSLSEWSSCLSLHLVSRRGIEAAAGSMCVIIPLKWRLPAVIIDRFGIAGTAAVGDRMSSMTSLPLSGQRGISVVRCLAGSFC